MQLQSLGQEDPLEEAMQPTAVFLPGECMDRGAWWATVLRVTKELDMTEVTQHACTCIMLNIIISQLNQKI